MALISFYYARCCKKTYLLVIGKGLRIIKNQKNHISCFYYFCQNRYWQPTMLQPVQRAEFGTEDRPWAPVPKLFLGPQYLYVCMVKNQWYQESVQSLPKQVLKHQPSQHFPHRLIYFLMKLSPDAHHDIVSAKLWPPPEAMRVVE